MMLDAAVVTVGSELVEGLRMDTNGPEIAVRLADLGYRVRDMVSVADEVAYLAPVLATLCERFPLVVCTGGLGPTHDDITREAASSALGLRLDVDERIATTLKRLPLLHHGARISVEMLRQAEILEGARVLPAITGTAPGQEVATPGGRLLLLPGPPRECMPILDRWAADEPSRMSAMVDLSLFGLTESQVQHKVQDVLSCYGPIEFTVLASLKEVHVILTDLGAGEADLRMAVAEVRAALGDTVFSDEGRTLPEVVIDLARAKGVKLVTAESCTGGLIAGALTDVPGASDVVLGGIVSYADEVKHAQLDVAYDDLRIHGAVSEPVARQMAEGARSALGADIAVSVTGIAGPGGGSDEKPVGMVWFGLATPDGVFSLMTQRGGSRDTIRTRTVYRALDLIRRYLLGLPLETS